MITILKILWKMLLIIAGVYVALVAVFFFDLDGKLLVRKAGPRLVKRCDKMERSADCDINK